MGTSRNAARIVRFWRACEVFTPQTLQDIGDGVFDVSPGDPMPWEAEHERPRTSPEPGKVRRYVVYGGVYKLSALGEALVKAFKEEGGEDDGRLRGQSALFACRVDESGHLIEGSAVLSACAYAAGRLRQRRFRSDAWLDGFDGEIDAPAEHPLERAALKTLLSSLREALPDGAAEVAKVTTLAAMTHGFSGAAALTAGLVALSSSVTRNLMKAVTGGGSEPAPGSTSSPTPPNAGPLTGEQLTWFAERLAHRLGVEKVLNPQGFRVRVYDVSASHAAGGDDDDFLNSLIARDLACVEAAIKDGDAGVGIGTYLSRGGYRWLARRRRTDVRRRPWTVFEGLAPRRIPPGRWVTDTNKPLVLSQQFAVNQIMAELSGGSGMFAVNGPPGTGKTTMLRDLIAAIVVERAKRLADLDCPAAGFTDRTLPWRREDKSRTFKVTELSPALTGFEMVVASANNKAVENVTDEIPGRNAIGAEWRTRAEEVDYFRDTARRVLEKGDAWGMVAARLGNRRNCSRFVTDFWWHNETPEYAVSKLSATASDWATALSNFRHALNTIDQLVEQRQQVHDIAGRLLAAERQRERAQKAIHGWRRRLQPDQGRGANALRSALCNVLTWWPSWRLDALRTEIATLQHQLQLAQRSCPGPVPSVQEFMVPDGDAAADRECSSPWADELLTSARTELFLAALELHKAFIAAERKNFGKNLGVLMDILSGVDGAPPEVAHAAWQTLFLLVPVVSTTFASLGRMFGQLGRESLGWLFVDEAGQATPQQAVGGIWRAKRTVVVGDPRQLEPVVTLPRSGESALRRYYRVKADWAPSLTSVQVLADRQARHGTSLPGTDGSPPAWVGAPLRVHRRCEQPMFEISNQIAYDGMMIYGTHHDDEEPFRDLASSTWLDVVSRDVQGRHWVREEGMVLGCVLRGLRAAGIQPHQVAVLSPFRAIAKQARDVHRSVWPNVLPKERNDRVGTVHTMQGREAPVVVLVLGTHPSRGERARAWAANPPNLLNVAVSRAQRRLYVIGNRQEWKKQPAYGVLAQRLGA